MSCIQEPATKSYLGPAEYTPHDDDDGYIYLLQLLFQPVAVIGWLVQK